MIITINYNDDNIYINEKSMGKFRDIHQIERLLYEILTIACDNTDENGIDVSLKTVDEDNLTVISEW